MRFLKRLALLLPWRRRAAERDMQDELRSLAAMAAPGELGNLTLAAEDARREWGWTRLEQTLQDVRYRGFTLQRTPRREPLEIIGVVRDSPYPNLREAPQPTVYQTFRQTSTGRGQMVLHVRVDGDANGPRRAISDAVQAIDPAVPMFELHTLADEVDAALVRERLVATLSGFFGLVALALVCVGLYGLMAFTVSSRTAEIGVRLALGATRADVRWMIARETLTLLGAGVALGLPAAWLVGRLASAQTAGLLFELSASDPVTVIAACLLLVAVAVCAGLLPAQRAARIDPTVALRTD